MENKQSMVKVENLEVFYGGIQAIHGISLEIFQGEMVAIICLLYTSDAADE